MEDFKDNDENEQMSKTMTDIENYVNNNEIDDTIEEVTDEVQIPTESKRCLFMFLIPK